MMKVFDGFASFGILKNSSIKVQHRQFQQYARNFDNISLLFCYSTDFQLQQHDMVILCDYKVFTTNKTKNENGCNLFVENMMQQFHFI